MPNEIPSARLPGYGGPHTRGPITRQELDRIMAARAAGVTWRMIQERFGRTENFIKKAQKKLQTEVASD